MQTIFSYRKSGAYVGVCNQICCLLDPFWTKLKQTVQLCIPVSIMLF